MADRVPPRSGRPAATASRAGTALRGRGRRERDVVARAEQAGQRGIDQVEIPDVGHDDQRAAAGRRGRARGPGDRLRPVRAGQRRPGRPGGRRRASAARKRTGRGAGPGSRRGRGRRLRARLAPRSWRGLAAAACVFGAACRGGIASRSTSAIVPPYLSATSRASADLRGQHRLGGHHPLQERQAALVLARLGARPSRYPPVSRPANLTRTRQPGTASWSGAARAPGSRRAGPGGAGTRRRPPAPRAAPPRPAQDRAAVPGPPGGPAGCRLAARVPADWLPLPRSCPTRAPGRPRPSGNRQPRAVSPARCRWVTAAG